MSSKAQEFIRNISYSFIANILSMFAGIVSILVFPKFIGIDSFGYYQLYLFYIGYVTLTSLGWSDGNYLHIGGKTYNSLNKNEQSTQFWMLAGVEVVLYMLFSIKLYGTISTDKGYVLLLTCACAVFMNMRYYLTLVLQATNRIKEYSQLIIIERIIPLILSLAIILGGYRGYSFLIWIDVFGRFLSIALGLWYCKDLIFVLPKPTFKICSLSVKNMFAGSMVLLATLSSSLIIGAVRFGIEKHWDIITFSKVSLTISISNMATRAINAIGIVMFPTLRRTDPESLPTLYSLMNTGLMALIFAALIFYYPCAEMLKLWLPQYADSVRYAAILLPVCAYECKNVMLVSTYLKTMRMEKVLLLINIIAIAFSVIFTGLSVYLLNSVELAVFSMLIALMVRCIAGELLLGYRMQVKMTHILPESSLVVAFVITNWYLGAIGVPLYIACYFIYIVLNWKQLLNTQRFIKSKMIKERG